jgi:tetraacyldisaccharide 4'-kinase
VRGIAGIVERSWSGEPGGIAWTKALLPLAAGYAAVSGLARRRAAAGRRKLEGVHVIAVGNLTVGGAGKSSLARWLALQALTARSRAAVLLRGHGSDASARGTRVVPDFSSYPVLARVGAYGDEAIAHRVALPRDASVAVDVDRFRAARALLSGYGSRVLILDDGWEQGTLAWDELWVAVDPRYPAGNGSLLPAGPLRRPTATLRESTRIVFLLEEADETIPDRTLAWLDRWAPRIPHIRFQRILHGVSPVGEPESPAALTRGSRVAVVSGVGAPHRLERFLRGAGVDVRLHLAYPDHARWRAASLEASARRARAAGADEILITEKDEPRWPALVRAALPVRVIRSAIRPLDSVDEALAPIRAAAAGVSPR